MFFLYLFIFLCVCARARVHVRVYYRELNAELLTLDTCHITLPTTPLFENLFIIYHFSIPSLELELQVLVSPLPHVDAESQTPSEQELLATESSLQPHPFFLRPFLHVP